MDEQLKGWTLRHLDGTEYGLWSTCAMAQEALGMMTYSDEYIIVEVWE